MFSCFLLIFYSNILAAIDEITKSNDKMTAQDIQLKIEEDLGVSLSLSSVRHARRLLGRKTPFSQMTEEINNDPRLQRVLQRIESGEIWDDSTEVPQQDDRPQLGRVIKLHIWGMISQHDACPKTILHEILDKRRSQKPNQVAAARLGLDEGFFEEMDLNPTAAAEPSALKHIKLVVIAVAKDNWEQSGKLVSTNSYLDVQCSPSIYSVILFLFYCCVMKLNLKSTEI